MLGHGDLVRAARGRPRPCTTGPRKASTRCAKAEKNGGIRERGLTWLPQGLCSIVQNVRSLTSFRL
ncbi:hypothetical protein DESPIGER_0894 [Desulfovibrio piger]|uniref:Uncharacterized protein n=1 Tax=Desulfovibrio piger TaxID=901 RepID=A0A1K1LDI3_9BACT|nr:hypothetical protein DESPIGER_0894 [Desulfovibrio piger]